jgi:hypothetical protein
LALFTESSEKTPTAPQKLQRRSNTKMMPDLANSGQIAPVSAKARETNTSSGINRTQTLFW